MHPTNFTAKKYWKVIILLGLNMNHILPGQVIIIDEFRVLVPSHSTFNMNKGDHLIGNYYVEKLISR